jgi:putative transposase
VCVFGTLKWFAWIKNDLSLLVTVTMAQSRNSGNLPSKKRKRPPAPLKRPTALLFGFWTPATTTRAAALWEPSTALDTPYQQTQGKQAWFSATIWRQSTQGPTSQDTSLLARITAVATERVDVPSETKKRKKKKEDESDDKPILKTRKYRLYPTTKQKQTLNEWFGAARWSYNAALGAINNKEATYNRSLLRRRFVNKDGPDTPDWALKTPYDIRGDAIIDLIKAHKSTKALLKAGHCKQYTMRFRSRKAASESLPIQGKHYKGQGVLFPRFLGKAPIRGAPGEPLPASVDHDIRLQRTKDGRYYLCVPVPLDVHESQVDVRGEKGYIAAIDPGVRTFATVYDAKRKQVVEFGAGDMSRIRRLAHAVDVLQSKVNNKTVTRRRQRYRYRKAQARLRAKIRALVDDLHRKCALFLCRHYDTILLPTFDTQQMVKKKNGKRQLGRRTCREMMTWAHYRFRSFLQHKAREYPGVNVVLVSEAYTSKTCGRCGKLHRSLGSSKSFVCPQPHCGFQMDRDWNGARNILLRYMATHLDADGDIRVTPPNTRDL